MAGKNIKHMLPQDVDQRLKQGEAMHIIDVREAMEWQDGHIPQARNIPLAALNARHQELDQTVTYVVVCQSGNRSSLACEWLEKLGYTVYNMPGGMLAWHGATEYGGTT